MKRLNSTVKFPVFLFENRTFPGLYHCSGIVLVAVLSVLQGCATYVPSLTPTCRQADFIPVLDTETRESKKLFSILPPDGSNWCIAKSTASAIEYRTSSIMGKTINRAPRREDFSHTVFVFAVPLEFGETDMSNLQSITKALETWAQGREKTQVKDDGSWYVELLASQRDERFELVHFDSHAEENCIRWESRQEERDNPRFPGKMLKLNNAGVLCKHPKTDDRLIHLYFTERYLVEREDLQYSSMVRQAADRTFQSLEFMHAE